MCIRDSHSAQKFALLTKEAAAVQQKVRGKGGPPGGVLEGNISVADEKIEVAAAAGTKTVPVSDAADVLDVAAYEKAFTRHPGFLSDWNGAITAGGSIVEATQTSETFNESISLVRAVPAEDWLARRNRTAFDFGSSYGEQTQPGTPSIKTSIYHCLLYTSRCV